MDISHRISIRITASFFVSMMEGFDESLKSVLSKRKTGWRPGEGARVYAGGQKMIERLEGVEETGNILIPEDS